MKIAMQFIRTPHDDSADYDADWRRQLANALISTNIRGSLPSFIINDMYINKYSRYLSNYVNVRNRPGKYEDRRVFIINAEYKDMYVVQSWYDAKDSMIKRYLEPMLLTDLDFNFISIALKTTEHRIKLYERLFFNTRNKYGTLTASRALLMKFATANLQLGSRPDVFTEWKIMAVEHGVRALVKFWKWKITETMPCDTMGAVVEAAESLTLGRISRGDVSNRDLNDLYANYIAKQKLELDKDIAGKGDDKVTGIAQGILSSTEIKLLQLLKPDMAQQEETENELDLKKDSINRKLRVQKDISNTNVVDKGVKAAVTDLNRALKTQLE